MPVVPKSPSSVIELSDSDIIIEDGSEGVIKSQSKIQSTSIVFI